ncbi:MAG: hypothetical protein WC641_04185 [Patescibacteria group bacterium]
MIGEFQRVCYIGESDALPPPGGYRFDRLIGYLGRLRAESAFKPDEVKDLVGLLCDDELLAELSPDEQTFVRVTVKPTINGVLQRFERERRRAMNYN